MRIQRIQLPLLIGVLSILAGTAGAQAQTVLFDFEDGAQGWGSYGAITTDSGAIDGSVGTGRFHSADFSLPDTNFGIVDVSPFGQNLSPYGGLAVDARFVDVPGFEPFVGVRELDMIVATGNDTNEEEFFAPKQIMTDTYQTFAVPFSEFKSSTDQQRPTLDELANIRIKLVVLNTNGIGTARFDYDQVSGLAAGVAGDYNNNGVVDAADYTLWRDYLGQGVTLPNDITPGSVTQTDYDVWRSHLGMTAGSGSVGSTSAVPEPGAFGIMLTLTLTAAAATARRRRAGR